MRTVGMRFILGKSIKIDECMSCRVGRNCLAPALPKTKVNKSIQKREKKIVVNRFLFDFMRSAIVLGYFVYFIRK